jgi:hypothetical protein
MPGSFIKNDLTTLFATSDFGVANGDLTINGVVIEQGIFDDGDVEVDSGEGVAQIVPRPVFITATDKIPTLADGDTLEYQGFRYTVKNWIHDGTGVTTIYLERF